MKEMLGACFERNAPVSRKRGSGTRLPIGWCNALPCDTAKAEAAEFAKFLLLYRHSMNATIGDLRYRMKDVLRAIDRGETVTVLYRGKAKAALMPISPPAGTSNKGTPKIADRPRCLASQRAPTARGPL